ncbi:MAG: hypothetical protein NTX36_13065 [Proteobacteria bacterium]|nr:hypothetical protein [Pseudomonadota bacterium]
MKSEDRRQKTDRDKAKGKGRREEPKRRDGVSAPVHQDDCCEGGTRR